MAEKRQKKRRKRQNISEKTQKKWQKKMFCYNRLCSKTKKGYLDSKECLTIPAIAEFLAEAHLLVKALRYRIA